MFLVIDAGNTRIKYGCHDGTDWLRREVLQGPRIVLPPTVSVEHIVISNVAGSGVEALLQTCIAAWPSASVEWLQASRERCGVINGYAEPYTLGSDRWACLIGARCHGPQDWVVVSAGTATTIDGMSAEGRFLGGFILPGVGLMRESLARGTAALPADAGSRTEWPVNTRDAIFSGCIEAQAGAIMRMAARLPQARIILTGGAAPALVPLLPPVIEAPWLCLEGLLAVARADRRP